MTATPAQPNHSRAMACLTEIYQKRGLADVIAKLVPADKSWVFSRGLIRLEVHPVQSLKGDQHGRLLNLTDGHERIAVGAVLNHVDDGLVLVDVQTRSLSELRDPPQDADAEIALKERLIYGLVEQFSMRWPPTTYLSPSDFTSIN